MSPRRRPPVDELGTLDGLLRERCAAGLRLL